MRFREIMREYDAAAAANQMQQAFDKTRLRQQFYGRTAADLKGDPEEIGDTWDDYKQYIRTFGQRPKTKPQPAEPENPQAVPLDVEKLQKPKMDFKQKYPDPWDTEANIDTVG
jgi:hypothetical protein